MKKIELYDCGSNNGMVAVGTTTAVKAHDKLTALAVSVGGWGNLADDNPEATRLRNIIANGLYVFAPSEESMAYLAGYAVGTYAELDTWLSKTGSQLLDGPSSWVPYSNGSPAAEAAGGSVIHSVKSVADAFGIAPDTVKIAWGARVPAMARKAAQDVLNAQEWAAMQY